MDMLDIYRQYGVDFRTDGHEHCRTGWVQTDCPYCSQHLKGHFRLGFNLTSRYFCCWSCGPQRLLDTVMRLTGVAYAECRELLSGYEIGRAQHRRKPSIKRGQVKLPAGVGELRQPHRDYLLRRGLNPTTVQNLWGVKGIGIASYLQWRLFIPIFFDWEIISWTTRSISSDTKLRYITADSESEKYPAKLVLYGEDYAKDAVIIVEGPIDVWKIGHGAVATLGTAYSREQVLRASRFPKRIICFDAEEAAQKRAVKLCEALSAFPGTTCNVILDSAKDPGAASNRELRQLRALIR